MASRSTQVIFQNRTNTNFALVKTSDNLDHGIWTTRPADFVGDSAEWESESSGFATGTAGSVDYEVKLADLSIALSMHLSWDNPFDGSNSYEATVAPPGQPDGTGFSIGFFGGGGDNATVTFVLLSGKCEVDQNTGEVICTESTPVVAADGIEHYAGIWEQMAGSPAWRARHGLTATQYQQTFDQLVGQGYRLTDVSGYSVAGQDHYAGIWEQRVSPPWQARHGLTAAQYQQTFDQLVGQGYRLVLVNGYGIAGQDRYAAIWEKSAAPPWQARHGLTATQYQQTFDQLVGQGYRLIHVSGYTVGGLDQYAAIWEQSAGPPWQARHGLTAAQYQQSFDQFVGQGYRLVRVSGYNFDGQDHYAAIWELTAGPAWQARHGLTAAQYQQAFDQLVGQGLRLVYVSGYSS
jgi:hypothetical protein